MPPLNPPVNENLPSIIGIVTNITKVKDDPKFGPTFSFDLTYAQQRKDDIHEETVKWEAEGWGGKKFAEARLKSGATVRFFFAPKQINYNDKKTGLPKSFVKWSIQKLEELEGSPRKEYAGTDPSSGLDFSPASAGDAGDGSDW